MFPAYQTTLLGKSLLTARCPQIRCSILLNFPKAKETFAKWEECNKRADGLHLGKWSPSFIQTFAKCNEKKAT